MLLLGDETHDNGRLPWVTGSLIAMKALNELMSKHCLPIPWMK